MNKRNTELITRVATELYQQHTHKTAPAHALTTPITREPSNNKLHYPVVLQTAIQRFDKNLNIPPQIIILTYYILQLTIIILSTYIALDALAISGTQLTLYIFPLGFAQLMLYTMLIELGNKTETHHNHFLHHNIYRNLEGITAYMVMYLMLTGTFTLLVTLLTQLKP